MSYGYSPPKKSKSRINDEVKPPPNDDRQLFFVRLAMSHYLVALSVFSIIRREPRAHS